MSIGKKIYFKVYQDRDNVGGTYYVETPDGINNSLPEWEECHLEYDEPFPVIEPVLMTEEEFNSLPDFNGY